MHLWINIALLFFALTLHSISFEERIITGLRGLSLAHRANFGDNIGLFCEYLARKKIHHRFPERYYRVYKNLTYGKFDSPEGELDLLVMNRRSHNIEVAVEVKCRTKSSKALQTGLMQLERIASKIDTMCKEKKNNLIFFDKHRREIEISCLNFLATKFRVMVPETQTLEPETLSLGLDLEKIRRLQKLLKSERYF